MTEFFLDYKYAVIIVGLLFGGTPALLGLIYLVLNGFMSFWEMLLLVVFCTMLWDTAWYIAGRFFSLEKISSLKILKKYKPWLEWSGKIHSEHSVRFLFLSRFLYGVNSIAEVLCGVYKMKFIPFIFTNIASILVWVLVLTSVGVLLDRNLESLEGTSRGFIIAPLVFFIIMVGFYVVVKKVVRSRYDKDVK